MLSSCCIEQLFPVLSLTHEFLEISSVLASLWALHDSFSQLSSGIILGTGMSMERSWLSLMFIFFLRFGSILERLLSLLYRFFDFRFSLCSFGCVWNMLSRLLLLYKRVKLFILSNGTYSPGFPIICWFRQISKYFLIDNSPLPGMKTALFHILHQLLLQLLTQFIRRTVFIPRNHSLSSLNHGIISRGVLLVSAVVLGHFVDFGSGQSLASFFLALPGTGS